MSNKTYAWYLNDNLNLTGFSKIIQFVSNGYTYGRIRSIRQEYLSYAEAADNYSDVVYAYDDGWLNEGYRTIKFLEEPTGELLEWLQDNGVEQNREGEYKFTRLYKETQIEDSKTVTPTSEEQVITPSEGFVALKQVIVEASQSGGIIPEGTLYITENGVYDVTEKAQVNVNVEGEGTLGEPVTFTLEADKWDGTNYIITTSDYGTISQNIRIGIPPESSMYNANILVESALTIPYVEKNKIYISAVTAPTVDIIIAIYGLSKAE